MERYRPDMERLFEQLSRSRHGLVLVRETVAQHFRGTGSFANISQARNLTHGQGCACTPHTHSDYVASQNDLLRSLADKHPRVGIAPLYNITLKRHNLHMETHDCYNRTGASCCDCTHYCYNDGMYREFWEGVLLAAAHTHDDRDPHL